MSRRRRAVRVLAGFAVAWAVALASPPAARAEMGVVIAGTGPVNLSMGGASTAAPLDSAGALYWNPATMMGLPSSELEAGAAILYARTRVSSFVPAGSIFPG